MIPLSVWGKVELTTCETPMGPNSYEHRGWLWSPKGVGNTETGEEAMKGKDLTGSLVISCVVFLVGCSMTVEIEAPPDGTHVGSGTFDLQGLVKSTGYCMGGERCGHVDWVIRDNGDDICWGTETGGSGDYAWCTNYMGDYCHFHWDDIDTSDLGDGTHVIEIEGSATCHMTATDSITIHIP